MHTKNVGFIVSDEMAGTRLDRALETAFPGTGLRYRRRLWDEGRVLVDGVERARSYKVRAGVKVVVEYGRGDGGFLSSELLITVFSTSLFAAVFKPGGLHSAQVAGKTGGCAEELLPELFPNQTPLLLNRLDCPTSGLLMVAFSPDAAQKFREEENAGRVEKRYLAVVRGQGAFAEKTVLKNQLDTDNRRKSRVLREEVCDPLRWTEAVRVRSLDDADAALVTAVIRKGARHQIRAHLAYAGHPIVGDPLYGDGKAGDVLHLHHGRIRFPGFEAAVRPVWETSGFDGVDYAEWGEPPYADGPPRG